MYLSREDLIPYIRSTGLNNDVLSSTVHSICTQLVANYSLPFITKKPGFKVAGSRGYHVYDLENLLRSLWKFHIDHLNSKRTKYENSRMGSIVRSLIEGLTELHRGSDYRVKTIKTFDDETSLIKAEKFADKDGVWEFKFGECNEIEAKRYYTYRNTVAQTFSIKRNRLTVTASRKTYRYDFRSIEDALQWAEKYLLTQAF